MALPKQKLREIVISLLYAMEMGDVALEFFMEQFKTTKRSIQEATQLAEAVFAKRAELDQKLQELSKAFAVDRIHKTELQILRLALFEIMLPNQEVPPKVAVAEAIRLARKLASWEGAQYVNAVLDPLLHADL